MKYLVLFIFFFSQYFYSQQFRDVTTISDLDGFFANNGVAVADYDQDGDLDIFIVRANSDSSETSWSRLLENTNNGNYIDVTENSGIGQNFFHEIDLINYDENGDYSFDTIEHGDRLSASWGDFNNDGFPDLFLGFGNQTKFKVTKSLLKDIQKGAMILHNNSKYDIGQSILIQEGNVIGIEAIQGTDNLIKQSLPYMQKVKKGVLIKLVKVKQDLRADLPTIGLKTLKYCLKSGVVGIAYSANKTIFLDKEKILSFCIKNKFFLYGL